MERTKKDFPMARGFCLTNIAAIMGIKRFWFEKIPRIGDWLLRKRVYKKFKEINDSVSIKEIYKKGA